MSTTAGPSTRFHRPATGDPMTDQQTGCGCDRCPHRDALEALIEEAAQLRAERDAERERCELLRAERDALTIRNARLDKLAGIDPLTELLNRRGMHANFRHVRSTIGCAGVGLIDLDLFKTVNDNYGHAAGDAVLVHVADAIRDLELIGVRLGGDEFAVLVPAGGSVATAMRNLASRIAQPVKVPSLDGGIVEVVIGTSIGYALAGEVTDPNPEGALSAMLALCDTRTYMAKDAGRGRCVGPQG